MTSVLRRIGFVAGVVLIVLGVFWTGRGEQSRNLERLLGALVVPAPAGHSRIGRGQRYSCPLAPFSRLSGQLWVAGEANGRSYPPGLVTASNLAVRPEKPGRS